MGQDEGLTGADGPQPTDDQSPAEVRYPRWYAARVLVVAGCAALLLATAVLLVASGGRVDQATGSVIFWSSLAGQVGLGLGVWFAVALAPEPPARLLAWQRVAPTTLLAAAVGTVAVSLASDWLRAEVTQHWPSLGSHLEAAGDMLAGLSGEMFLVALVAFTVLPSLIEEGLCRGVVHRAYRTAFGPAAAVVAGAVAFGLIHADWLHGGLALIMGLYLGLWRERTGSLQPAVAGHLANNAVALLVVRFWPEVATSVTGPQAALGLALGLALLAGVRSSA